MRWFIALGLLSPILVAAPLAAAPLALDPTFGSGGRVTTDATSGFDSARDGVLLPDGRIVVCGSGASNTRFVLVRYQANGVVDSTFGVHGVVSTSFTGSGVEATAIQRQADGKLVVAGHQFDSGTFVSIVARYAENGVLDSTFGAGGRVIQTIGPVGEVLDCAIQSDGRIIIAGSFRVTGTITFVGMRRYHTDGRVDSSFGVNGTVTRGPGVDHHCNDIELQPDGRIVVAGSVQPTTGALYQILTFRFKANGTPDSTFGGFGRISTDVSVDQDFGSGVALMSDGRIVVSGHVGSAASTSHRYSLLRFHADGRRDSTLDSDGIALSPIVGHPNGYSFSNDLLLLPSGAVLLCGQTTLLGTSDDFGFAQFTASGAVDLDFDTDGVAQLDMSGTGRDIAYQMLRQADGRILVLGPAGSGAFPGGARFGLARFTGGDATADAPPEPSGPSRLMLTASGANPFREQTRLAFRLPEPAHVSLRAYDVSGRAAGVLLEGAMSAGVHEVAWDAREWRPGLWFVRLVTTGRTGATESAVLRMICLP